ncbi:uncharacterized protein B0I36DRAFT_372081 [Microdochium trichocladiopsis]|uniref:Short-chain dehydrogenase n=1 Tax=Microdochium trichocladiopsis TaxID=1682393 RepID=A0A9P8YF41_9PEZI|nr:uncharacterized protein B0I36DRAFT_372081 [Microdochium trichocladiopsis]KAH7037762.1 hypothetical protein B0I36DRAFT_372081 [Microdochium trichocladiopsis]
MAAASAPAFDKNTRGSDVTRLFKDCVEGRHIVITGVSPNSLGEATALALAASNPRLLILASRTASKVDIIAATIKSRFPSVEVQTVILDLASQDSIRAGAAQIVQRTDRLDLLINNAGISLSSRGSAPNGLELTFATNHVGPYLLTELLLPLLRHAAKDQATRGTTRIVTLSSGAHYVCPFRFSDYNFDGGRSLPADEEPRKGLDEHFYEVKDGFAGWMAYASSKTANILFTVSLRERLCSDGIQCLAVDPGIIMTNLAGDMTATAAAAVTKMPKELFKSTDQGCATTVVAALDPGLAESDTLYLADCQKARPARHARDKIKAERLWKLSERLVGGKVDSKM